MSTVNQVHLNIDDFNATVITFGASLSSLCLKGQQLLRTIPADRYPQTEGHFGSIAGPIANRIKGAEVKIDGTRYSLPKNDGENTLHGGPLGLGRREWSIEDRDHHSVTLILKLADGELGLPGNRVFRCRYELSSIGARYSLFITLTMTTSEGTLCNLAPHPYFCLDNSGSILNHELTIFADHYLPTDERCLPTGVVASVENSRFDLRKPTLLRNLSERNQLTFDHNFCIARSNSKSQLKKVATLSSLNSGISMSIHSNQWGLQVYSPKEIGVAINGKTSPNELFPSICLEPQSWPDGPNHRAFPSIYIPRGETYEHVSRFDFTHKLPKW